METSFRDVKKMKENDQVCMSNRQMYHMVQTIGGDAYVLFMYYHTKYQRWNWRDKNIAKELGWSESKMKRLKLVLRKAGYLYWYKSGNHKFTFIGPYNAYIGKIEELKDHGYDEDEAIGILNHKIDIGEIVVLSKLPDYHKHLYNDDYIEPGDDNV